jgi:LPXTG-motif cell wall-anchored protein
MLLAALLAMVMAAAAPAFAQTAVGGDTAVLQYSCNEIQAAVNTQYQAGEGTGAVAGAAQSLGVNQNQVEACFGTAVAAQQSTININTATADSTAITVHAKKGGTATAGGGGGGSASAGGGGSASAASGGSLPETGGASLIALGAGALLVAGGLLARRIVR